MTDERVDDTEHEEDYRLDADVVDTLLDAVADEDAQRVISILEPLHAADIADLLEQVSGSERRDILRLYGDEMDGEILAEINESIREEVIDELEPTVLADAVREMDSDDVVDLIETIEERSQQEVILSALDDRDRIAVEKSLTYPEFSAGRLMQREVVTAPGHWTVGETIDYLRSADWLPDQFYHVILVDPMHHPIANVTLGRVLSAPRTAALSDIAEDEFRAISVYQEEGDVAYAFNQYHLISVPVVDENGRLVGVITIDDAMSVLDEEHEEDILRLAGVGDDSSITDTVWETVQQRLPWLFVNLLTAIMASMVISVFEGTIQQLVALAVLMPIVASMGGNAGTQTLTVAVRALATKSVTESNVWRVIRREVVVGLINGLAFAVVMGLVAYIWFDGVTLGAVIAVAMVINLVVAALAGIVVPLVLERFGADPALASGTFVTTVTDVVGFFAFLGLAGVWML
ncbi:magnesium transporter [Thioclava sp. SK-1]|uniref:magnesium transporter n=1 Tax=Thioclava sp. SK-1 TaxID=1889770 RepID=UPI0008263B1F|nr:magnesium transporter [Thioclava sp. SK-1]OCX62302.1 magnesium transporter [Thioclava sp. SK-1]